jgi:hypothetical protein
MPKSTPVWVQRLSADLRRRLEVAEAGARQDRYRVHAEQALDLVAVLASRMHFDDALDHYTRIMDLDTEDAEIVRTRALVMLGNASVETGLPEKELAPRWKLEWRYATPLGAVRFVRRQLRRSAEEDLLSELSVARAEEMIIVTHVRHALQFAHLLDEHVPPPRSVSYYLDRLEIPAARSHSVYQRALAELAEIHLPRLMRPPADD